MQDGAELPWMQMLDVISYLQLSNLQLADLQLPDFQVCTFREYARRSSKWARKPPLLRACCVRRSNASRHCGFGWHNTSGRQLPRSTAPTYLSVL